MANKPIHVVRDGRVKATIWKNSGKNGDFYTVQFGRTFENGEGQLQDSDSFSGTDILQVQFVALQAYGWVQKQRQRDKEAANE